jgi:cysteine desulfurase
VIYLDYASGTPMRREVLDKFIKTETRFPGNPNSRHPMGEAARSELERVTDSVAGLLGVGENEIIFTSGSSEGNNTAVVGLAYASRCTGRHIISTPLEHASVGGALTALQEMDFEVDMVRIGPDGKIDLDDLRSLLRRDTVLVSVSAVDSELGVVQPTDEISRMLKDYPDCRLHVDATQAIGKVPFSFRTADTVSFSPRKFYGPSGCGVLYKRRGVPMEPLIHGGSGPSLYRAGTPALSLYAAAETALHLALEEMPANYAAVKTKNDLLRAELSKYPRVRFNSPPDAVPYILNLSVDGVKGTAFQAALARRGVCVSVKSACSSDGLPSRAVMAVSCNRRNALSSWRISLSQVTTDSELAEFLQIFDCCYGELVK